jgi:hypothetical protein
MGAKFSSECRGCRLTCQQPMNRLRITPTHFGFECPACFVVQFRPLSDDFRATVLLSGARSPLTERNLDNFRQFLDLMSALSYVAEREGARA